MKRLAIVVIAIVVLGGIALTKTSKVEIINTEPQVVETEVRVPEIDGRIKDAQNAEMGNIELKAQKVYQEEKDRLLLEVENSVLNQISKELEERKALNEEKISL